MSFIYRIGVLTRHVISGSSSPLHRCILHLSNENIKKNDDPSGTYDVFMYVHLTYNYITGSVNKEVSIQFLQAMRNVPSPGMRVCVCFSYNYYYYFSGRRDNR